MSKLAKHIEILLLDNDCVAIPGFGGFVTYYEPAKRVEGRDIFLPPARAIGFNPRLEMNDGLLVQSYMKSDNTSFFDATRAIEQEVAHRLTCLRETGKVDFPGVGEIRYTASGGYEFTPCRNKIVTPYLYGLGAFEMKALSELNPAKAYETKKAKSIAFAWFRYVGSAAAMLLLFFLMSEPVKNTKVEERNYARLLPSDIFKPTVSKPDTVNKVIRLEEKKLPEPPIAVKEVVKKEIKKEIKLTTPQYHIIVLGGVNFQTAKNNVTALKRNGFVNAKVLNEAGKIRVSMMSFSNRNEAYKKVLLLRQKKDYKDAWVMTYI